MKHFKKLIICLLTIFVLAGNQTTYVSAATETAASAYSDTVYVYTSKNGADVEFAFDYADGVTVYGVRYEPLSTAYDYEETYSGFSNDRWTVVITARKRFSSTTVILGAWCDIYGQTGTL